MKTGLQSRVYKHGWKVRRALLPGAVLLWEPAEEADTAGARGARCQFQKSVTSLEGVSQAVPGHAGGPHFLSGLVQGRPSSSFIKLHLWF